jgi:hypothetical protein
LKKEKDFDFTNTLTYQSKYKSILDTYYSSSISIIPYQEGYLMNVRFVNYYNLLMECNMDLYSSDYSFLNDYNTNININTDYDSLNTPIVLWLYPNIFSYDLPPDVLPCFLADSKVLTDKGLVCIQLLKKGDLVQTLNDGLLPIKFVGKRSFFNKLTEERINPHLYKLNKVDFPELLENLFITGGHPLLVDDKDLDEETKKKLLDMVDYGTPIITEGKYRVFACVHPKAELWNDEKKHDIFDIVLENEDPKKNYGIWVNGILTESMDEEYFLNESGMKEINN